MANITVIVLTLAMLGLMVGTTLSVQPQQASAERKNQLFNGHSHISCDPQFTDCGGNSVFVQNTPAGHTNCNFNSHREEQQKCPNGGF
jgi:hypothetical protein